MIYNVNIVSGRPAVDNNNFDLDQDFLDDDDENKKVDIELMQYTGLKDKNGKEIYEGDILNDEVSFRVVRWDYKNAMFILPRDYDDNVLEMEVIGNIYENPDLAQQ